MMNHPYKVGDIVVPINDNKENIFGYAPAMDELIGIPILVENGGLYKTHKFTFAGGFFWEPTDLRLATEREKVNFMAKKPIKKLIKKPKKKSLYNLLSEIIARGRAGTSSYALRFKSGDTFNVNDVCNARMRWTHQNARDECLEVVQDIKFAQKEWLDIRLSHKFNLYVKYILNESPWADCFITKRVSDAKRYGVKLNLEYPVSALMGAVIALREGWEYGNKLKLFSEFKKKGYSGNVCYLFSSYIQENNTGSFSLCGMTSGHQVLNNQMDWEILKKFFKTGYSSKGKKSFCFTKQTGYAVFCEIDPTMYNGVPKNPVEKVFNGLLGIPPKKGFGREYYILKKKGIMFADWLAKELE